MKAQEVELWTREIVAAVMAGQTVEDTRVELKAKWIDSAGAAKGLAGHANAARGISILWLIGVDERNKNLTNPNPLELEGWYKAVESRFDGEAPRLLVDVNVRINAENVVALNIGTESGAPYVIKNSTGGFPEFIVPWREARRTRAASRAELLRILVPIRRLSGLLDELEFNAVLSNHTSDSSVSPICKFADEEFRRAMSEGAIASLPEGVRIIVYEAYRSIGEANQAIAGLANQTPRTVGWSNVIDAAIRSVVASRQKIANARKELQRALTLNALSF
jgi:hypothetical protein